MLFSLFLFLDSVWILSLLERFIFFLLLLLFSFSFPLSFKKKGSVDIGTSRKVLNPRCRIQWNSVDRQMSLSRSFSTVARTKTVPKAREASRSCCCFRMCASDDEGGSWLPHGSQSAISKGIQVNHSSWISHPLSPLSSTLLPSCFPKGTLEGTLPVSLPRKSRTEEPVKGCTVHGLAKLGTTLTKIKQQILTEDQPQICYA